MISRMWLIAAMVGIGLAPLSVVAPAPACCPAPPRGQPVVNADQTVIILWDAATKVQHFVRKASFKSDAEDFGFLIPSPTQPELSESGNEAFPHLQKLTEPEVIKQSRPVGDGISCGCAAKTAAFKAEGREQVTVLEEKLVAGFQAAILETKDAGALVAWLKDHGYAYSPEIQVWATPYVEQGWKITALKVAKPKDGEAGKTVAAGALRMSFRTDRPVFPYREPDPKSAAEALNAKKRLLRIYFLADARYQGEMTKESPWTGEVAWAGKLSAENRKNVLDLLKLPEASGPAEWWLTEFEDNWPYRAAPADVYFSRAADQSALKRAPIIRYVASPWPADGMVYVFAAALVLPPVVRRIRRRSKGDVA